MHFRHFLLIFLTKVHGIKKIHVWKQKLMASGGIV